LSKLCFVTLINGSATLARNTFEQTRISANPNPETQKCFRTYEMT